MKTLQKNSHIRKNGKSYDLKDEIIGDILILEKTNNKDKNLSIIWKCRCLLCNKEFFKAAAQLTRTHTNACGCSKNFIGRRNKNFRGYEQIHLSFFNKIIAGAKERNLEFNITIEQIWDLFIKQERRCNLSGLKLYFGKANRENTTASLDRIDSSKGYTIDNVQWLHKSVNFIKQNCDDDYFISICKLVADNMRFKEVGRKY